MLTNLRNFKKYQILSFN